MRRCLIIVGLVAALVWFADLASSDSPAPPAAARPAPAQAPAAPVIAPAVPVPAAPAQPPAGLPAHVARPAPQPSDRVWDVEGYGETPSDAKQRALDNASEAAETFLKERFPDLHRTPKENDRAYFQTIGMIGLDDKEPTAGTFGDLKGYEAAAHVDVSDPILRRMQERVDAERKKELEPAVTQRHWLAARILASFIALFLVIFGYIKLEELTRGYYTTLLRLGAGAVVVLAVLGLFLTP
jgi:hypothetical protein